MTMQATTDRYTYQQYVTTYSDPLNPILPIRRWVIALPPGPTTDWSLTSDHWQYGTYNGRAYRRAVMPEKVMER